MPSDNCQGKDKMFGETKSYYHPFWGVKLHIHHASTLFWKVSVIKQLTIMLKAKNILTLQIGPSLTKLTAQMQKPIFYVALHHIANYPSNQNGIV